MPYIYIITNTVNGKQYVGQTIKTVAFRFGIHKSHARNGKKYAIHCAIRKYGEDNFIIEELENLDTYDQPILDAREQHWVALYNTYNRGYNMTIGGGGTTGVTGNPSWTKGKKRSNATKEKIRQTLKTYIKKHGPTKTGKIWTVRDPSGKLHIIKGLKHAEDLGWSFRSINKYIRLKKSGPLTKGIYRGWEIIY